MALTTVASDKRRVTRKPRCTRLHFLAGLFLLVTGHLPLVTAFGQDIGNVGIRTVSQPVYTAAACAGPPAAVEINNRGQNVHFLIYQTAGVIDSISIEIQGRNDATLTWQRISSTATATGSGALFANVYLNHIRIAVTACSGAGTITATYSGTSVAATPVFGIFALGADSFERCTSQGIIQFTAGGAGSTRIIQAAGGGRRILVCHLSVALSAAADVIVERGTGANCATGNTDLTGAYENVVTLALDFGYWSALRTTVDNDVCLNVSAATTVGGVVIYAEL